MKINSLFPITSTITRFLSATAFTGSWGGFYVYTDGAYGGGAGKMGWAVDARSIPLCASAL